MLALDDQGCIKVQLFDENVYSNFGKELLKIIIGCPILKIYRPRCLPLFRLFYSSAAADFWEKTARSPNHRLIFFFSNFSVNQTSRKILRIYIEHFAFGKIYSGLQQTLPHPSLANSMWGDCGTSAGNYGKQTLRLQNKNMAAMKCIEPGSRG